MASFFSLVAYCGAVCCIAVLCCGDGMNRTKSRASACSTALYPTTLTPTLLYFTMRMGGNYTVNLNSAKPRYFLFLCNVLMYGKNSESTTFSDTEEAWRRYSLPLLCGIKNPVWEIL